MVRKSSPGAKFLECRKISMLISVYFCRQMLRTRIVRIILQCGMAEENASGECSGDDLVIFGKVRKQARGVDLFCYENLLKVG